MLGKRRLYRLGLFGLALLMGAGTGCLQFCHPIDPLPPEELHDTFQVPVGCKNRVYVFLLQGVDPLDSANMSGLQEYLHSIGYIKTYFGQPFHAFYYEKAILAIHQREPNARFALVGFSYGAGLVRDLARDLGKKGVGVDLLVYVDGARLNAPELTRPPNVAKVVNILAFDRSEDSKIEGAENIRHENVWHYGTVAHPDTLRMLVRELAEIALRVPLTTYLPAAPPADGVLPAPRPMPEMLPPPTPSARRGEWDYLRPDGFSSGVLGAKPVADALHMPPASMEQK
jgi:pimeloyl-ACP methyl ester carboxylesterase